MKSAHRSFKSIGKSVSLICPTARAKPYERQVYGFGLESRMLGCRKHEFGSFRQIEIYKLPAFFANSVIVALSLAVVTTGRVAKRDLMNKPRLFQIAQGIVDRCVADFGQ